MFAINGGGGSGRRAATIVGRLGRIDTFLRLALLPSIEVRT